MKNSNNMTHTEFNKKQDEMSQFNKQHGNTKPKVILNSKITEGAVVLQPNNASFTALIDKTEEYLNTSNEEKIPLNKASYCAYTGISLHLLNKFLNNNIDTLFSDASKEELEWYHKIQETLLQLMTIIEADVITGAMMDVYNSNISKLILSSDFEYKEKQSIETTTSSNITIIDDLKITDDLKDNES